MLKIKKIQLTNYTGYRKATFDFTGPDGSINPVSVFFGPNGCGKSNCLRAIDFLGRAKQFQGRENDLLFRKMIYHTNYDPTLPHFKITEEHMEVTGTFDFDGEEKIVTINSNFENNPDGVVRNDLAGLRESKTNLLMGMVYIDADHPMNMQKFQLPADRADVFKDIAETVYAYKVDLGKAVVSTEHEWDGREKTYDQFTKGDTSLTGESYDYYQDVIIDKGDTKVHFKSMSDGEKKIATLLRELCNPAMMDRSDVVLVDNIEMHIYFKRHARMLDKLLSCFPGKQFIVTTHSNIIIDHVEKTYGKDCLFNLSAINL